MNHINLAKPRPVHIVMALVFISGMLVSGFKFLDAREVTTIMARLNWWMVPPLLLLPLAFLLLKSERFTNLFNISGAPVSDPAVRRTTRISYISAQTATLLPGGYVARVGLMEASLKRGVKAVLPTLLEKILDLGLLLLVGLYACYHFPETSDFATLTVGAMLVLLIGAFAPVVRTKLKNLLALAVSRFGGEKLVRAALSGTPPTGSLATLLAVQTVGVLLIELTILWGSFTSLGISASPEVILLAYAVADVIGRIAPTPGGFGLTEVGMVAFLHRFDGMDVNEAAAATFLFRFLLFLVPALYGGLCYLFIWTRLKPPEASLATQKREDGISKAV